LTLRRRPAIATAHGTWTRSGIGVDVTKRELRHAQVSWLLSDGAEL
jgi:hypothetical protein